MSHNFSFLTRVKSDNEIFSKKFLIYFEIQETLNDRIYVLLHKNKLANNETSCKREVMRLCFI